VSVTHHGEVPHLDVIVEDEQLSLAIGKRGQNVRLASELIGCRIDIKSESDVKDEVADALARMLQTAISGAEAAAAATPAKREDVTSMAGVTPEIAAALAEAGLDTVDALLDASRSTLLSVEGVTETLADRLADWAQEQSAKREADAAEIGKAFRAPEAGSASMADEDFMAALSRAFQESEQQRTTTVKWPGEEDGEAPAATDEEPGEGQ
jgi:N utilization substance protein A